jgi:DNA polymerase III delta prime subunit
MTQTPGLYEFLRENGFYIEKNLAELIERVISSSRRVLIRGPAGTGKTQLTYLIARFLGAEYVFYQCTYGSSEDDLLYKYVPSEASKSGIKITLGPIPRALVLSKQKRVVLVLDEFDKTRPSADAMLLDVLQNFRVSLYLDDKETTIVGNPENLVVFLTSNDMREFSEPLLRRVVVITLKPLPTQEVLEILSKKFKKEVALLLAQIYDDTIKANLRKPATLQELFQLGEILETSPNTPLDDLIRMFIIKYDDDWIKYKQYVASRKMFEFLSRIEQKMSEEISKYYEPSEQEIEVQQRVEETVSSTVNQVLEKIAKVVVKQPKKLPEAREEVEEDTEATFKATISEGDITAYTAIVKELRPEPSDSGDIMGKFRVVKSDEGVNIISREPLSLEEYFKLLKTDAVFEAYVEDRVFLVIPFTINEILEVASKVYYYSKRLIRVEKTYNGVTELVEIELLDSPYSPSAKPTVANAVVRAYVKAGKGAFSRDPLILGELVTKKVCSITLDDVDANLVTIAERCMDAGYLDIYVKSVSDVDAAKSIAEKISEAAKRRGYKVSARLDRLDRMRIWMYERGFVSIG